MSATMQTIVAKPAPPPRVMIAWAMKMFRIIVMIKMIVLFISVVFSYTNIILFFGPAKFFCKKFHEQLFLKPS